MRILLFVFVCLLLSCEDKQTKKDTTGVKTDSSAVKTEKIKEVEKIINNFEIKEPTSQKDIVKIKKFPFYFLQIRLNGL